MARCFTLPPRPLPQPPQQACKAAGAAGGLLEACKPFNLTGTRQLSSCLAEASNSTYLNW